MEVTSTFLSKVKRMSTDNDLVNQINFVIVFDW